ncbi:MAG: hypothetical protein ACRDHV_11615, partial [Actinomycetota bacterium]
TDTVVSAGNAGDASVADQLVDDLIDDNDPDVEDDDLRDSAVADGAVAADGENAPAPPPPKHDMCGDLLRSVAGNHWGC